MTIDIHFDPYKYETLSRFHNSDAFICAIQGPFGSGKSTGAITKLFYNAMEQPPASDGVRYRRTAIVRNTYSQLQSTTIQTFSRWIPDQKFPVIGQAPIECVVDIKLRDGTRMKWTVWFLALDKPADLVKVKSLDISDVWINEAIEVPMEMIQALTGRVGRYPDKGMGGCPNPQVIIDTNPGDDDAELYVMLEGQDEELIASLEKKIAEYGRARPLIEFFKQPGALLFDGKNYEPNPLAENVDNLNGGHGYYFLQLAGKSQTWIDKFILGKYGVVEDGKPVYPEYKDDVHYSNEVIEPVPGVPIGIGQDNGLTPAIVLVQPNRLGQLVVLDEIVSFDMAAEEFLIDAMIPHLKEKYDGFDFFVVCDPSVKRAETDARTPMGILIKEGFKVKPAYTNHPGTRTNDVRHFLLKKNGIVVSKQCKFLRKGFQNGYKFKRLQVSGTRFSSSADKNHFSHVHDALQYILGHYAQLVRRKPKPVVRKLEYRFA